jgi:hypothetical protein
MGLFQCRCLSRVHSEPCLVRPAPPCSDYGFYRPTIDSHCIEFPDYNITQQAVCKDGRQKYYVSSGYAVEPVAGKHWDAGCLRNRAGPGVFPCRPRVLFPGGALPFLVVAD